MYFMGAHKDLFIVLKKSLKWLPVVGWVTFTFAI
jgi:1-acyl-sn-glycerol-3-phosphate acyltransferase